MVLTNAFYYISIGDFESVSVGAGHILKLNFKCKIIFRRRKYDDTAVEFAVEFAKDYLKLRHVPALRNKRLWRPSSYMKSATVATTYLRYLLPKLIVSITNPALIARLYFLLAKIYILQILNKFCYCKFILCIWQFGLSIIGNLLLHFQISCGVWRQRQLC